MTIDLPPNLYNDSSWMGLVLCAYFAIDVETTAHFDIPDLDTGPAKRFGGLRRNLQMGPMLSFK